MFINDTLAEEKAAELRARVVPVVWQATADAGAGEEAGSD
jgi:hypothetical protein